MILATFFTLLGYGHETVVDASEPESPAQVAAEGEPEPEPEVQDDVEAEPGEELSPFQAKLLGSWMIYSVNGSVLAEKYPGLKQPAAEWAADVIRATGERPQPYHLDESTTPVRIRIEESPEQTNYGLIAVEGDELKLKLPKPGTPPGTYPASMDSPDGQLMVFRRAEPTLGPVTTIGISVRGVYYGAGALRADGKAAAVRLADDVLVWDISNQRKVGRISPNFANGLGEISWSPDGKWIGVAARYCDEDAIGGYIYNAETMKPVLTLTGDSTFIRFSPDGRFFATGGIHGNPKLWSMNSGKVVYELPTKNKKSTLAAISPDSRFFATRGASVTSDRRIEVFAAVTGKKVADLEPNFDFDDRKMVFTPDNKSLLVLISGAKKGVWKFDLQTKKASPVIADVELKDMAFSSDGSTFLTSNENQIEIRDPKSYEILQTIDGNLDGDVIDTSRDGRFVLVASQGRGEIYDRQPAKDQQPAFWPPALTREQEAEFADANKFFDVNYQLFRDWTDIAEDGKPVLSWRVQAIARMDPSTVVKKGAWDAPDNKALLNNPPFFVEIGGSKGVNTVLQMVGGPGAYWNGIQKPNQGADKFTIRMVEASPEVAVPWSAPKDFVYDPSDPWKGLPKGGFHAGLTDGTSVWVRGETPPEVLKAMFTVDGGEEVDAAKWTLPVTHRFAFGPDETNPLPPFSPN